MRTYRKPQALAAEFGCTLHMMDKITKGLRSYPERYPNAVISSGHFAVLDKEMVLDWIKYREALETGTQIPPFRREEYQ